MVVKTVVSILCAVNILCGCATSTGYVDLKYTQKNINAVDGAEGVSVDVKVSDIRPDVPVGWKMNARMQASAPILATEDVSAVLQKAINGELKARGFDVFSKPPKIIISIDVVGFDSRFSNGFVYGKALADLDAIVYVKRKSDGRGYSKRYVSSGVEDKVYMASPENAELALNKALDAWVKYIFSDGSFVEQLLLD